MPVEVTRQIPPPSECSVFIQTVQGSVIRTLFEVLKDVVYESLLIITPERVKITTMDCSKSSLVYMDLLASSFEQFHCTSEHRCGISMLSAFKLIKTIANKTDIVTFFLHKQRPHDLGIAIQNEQIRACTVFCLKLLDMNHQDIVIPNFEYDSVVSMPSSTLQKMCRDMSNLGSFVDIETDQESMRMSVVGDFASQSTVFSTGSDEISLSTQHPFAGRFSLKFMNLFGRASSLSQQTSIYLKNQHPLVLSYDVGSLGELKFLLTPQLDEDE